MKQNCLLCERTSPDSNLYCQEVYCPAEMSPTILDHGEWLGNIEIIKPVVVLRSAVLYEARYHENKVLLKVAHPGAENRERLKREAEFLRNTQNKKEITNYLPRLLPPYTNTTLEREAYGKVVLRGHLLYYCLFEHFAGESLRDLLTKNQQLWVYHIGWIMTKVSSAVAFLQSKGMFHFGISPETVLVRLEDASDGPSVLLFDLGIASTRDGLKDNWYPFFVPPAYTAPELIDARTPSAHYATDVYGLGLTLYELLVGAPPYAYKLSSDEQVYQAVAAGRRVDMTRGEDVKAAADIAIKAVSTDLAARFPNAAELVKKLEECFGAPPTPKGGRNAKLALLVAGAVMAVVLVIFVGFVSVPLR